MKPSLSATRFMETAASPSESASSTPLRTMRWRLSPSLGLRSGWSRLQSFSNPDGGLSIMASLPVGVPDKQQYT